MINKLYKLDVADQFLTQSAMVKKQLLENLIAEATDDVIFMRRFRMIGQVAQFESQAVKKIFNFNSDNYDDYAIGLSFLLDELNSVALKNA